MHPTLVLLIAIAIIFLLIIRLHVNAFIALISAAMAVGILSPRVKLAAAMPETARIFGETTGKIGIVIALAAVIGQCLMESGAADKITRRIVALLGERYSSLSLVGSGYVLSIPVFFDTVFYLLVPLARAMRVRTHKNYLLYVMSICAGAAVSQSLVPPTPGPIAMAAALHLDLGTVILVGLLVGIPASLCGWFFSLYMDRRLHVELREAPGLRMEELEELAHKPENELPGFWFSIMPILLPVLFITSNTVVDAIDNQSAVARVTDFLGNPNFALLVSTAIALYLLARQKHYSLAQLAKPVETALANGGLIILITAGGGAFGGMLVLAGVGEALHGLSQRIGLPMLLLAFLLSVLFKVAQGSGTVAMITSAAIMSPLVMASTLPYHTVYIAMAIGSGSMVGSWMNDSGFWVVKQMSGLTEVETLKTWTPLLVIMGCVGIVVTLLASWLLPLK
jgi:GntP family gluconate:H+ symporter